MFHFAVRSSKMALHVAGILYNRISSPPSGHAAGVLLSGHPIIPLTGLPLLNISRSQVFPHINMTAMYTFVHQAFAAFGIISRGQICRNIITGNQHKYFKAFDTIYQGLATRVRPPRKVRRLLSAVCSYQQRMLLNQNKTKRNPPLPRSTELNYFL